MGQRSEYDLVVLGGGAAGLTVTAGAARLLHPAAERLGSFRWNVEDAEGTTAAEVRDALGATPDAAVPNIPRIDFAARVLLEHVLPRHAPDVSGSRQWQSIQVVPVALHLN